MKIQLVSSSVQTDPWQPLEGTKAPFVDDAAVIDLAKLGARGDHHGGTGGKVSVVWTKAIAYNLHPTSVEINLENTWNKMDLPANLKLHV